MPYVERENGTVVGLYGVSQSGYAEEFLPDNDPEVMAFRNPPPAMPPLSPRQIRLALLGAGITESMVDTALADNAAGMIEWKFATMYKRDHPLIDALAVSFALSTERVDELWQEAAQI